jgi:pyrroline-5-carboxylate reductase
LEKEKNMSQLNKTIAFIGAGNMGEALIRGLLAAKTVTPSQLVAADVRMERLEEFEDEFGIRVTTDNAQAAGAAEIVVLAVKPQQVSDVLATLHPRPSALILSIAAGVTTARIERELGNRPHVIRAMPNTPALIGAGAAAVCRGAHASIDDLTTAETILGAVGLTVRVEERFMDAVTALSGSGPAYVFRVTEAMIEAGVAAGLDPAVAHNLAIQTVYGAAKLLHDSGEEPGELRRNVTSPGGTTEAALQVMNDRQLTAIFTDAIAAATQRGRELSGN